MSVQSSGCGHVALCGFFIDHFCHRVLYIRSNCRGRKECVWPHPHSWIDKCVQSSTTSGSTLVVQSSCECGCVISSCPLDRPAEAISEPGSMVCKARSWCVMAACRL
jgi:hypothetical protein